MDLRSLSIILDLPLSQSNRTTHFHYHSLLRTEEHPLYVVFRSSCIGVGEFLMAEALSLAARFATALSQ